MKKILNKFGFVFCLFCSVFCTSCVSTRVSIGKKTDLYALEMPVSKKQDYILRFYGELKDDMFEITNIYWFDNWGNGWTEARYVASGLLKIKDKSSDEKYYTVIQPIVMEYPEAAKIRYKDTYLIKNEAITALNNRMARIESINELIAEYSQDLDYSDFNFYYRNLLFPEKFRKSPQRDELNKKAEKEFGDGTYWNVEYTQSLYPEYMWDARNSGTLFRDWEEAFDLIYVTYTWDSLFGEERTGVLNYVKTIKK